MDKEAKIFLLRRIRVVGLPLFLVLAAWFAWALAGDPYGLHGRPPALRRAVASAIEIRPRPPLEDCLQVAQAREMFKPSILYETKKNETVNVLGDLSFLGVVRSGGTVQAFIMNKKSGQSAFYVKGQTLEDLEIQEIQEGKVIFKHGEEMLDLVR